MNKIIKISRENNERYSQTVYEGTARDFRNRHPTTSNSRNNDNVNNQNTPNPDHIVNQMYIDGQLRIEWRCSNYSGNNRKYETSHCLPKSIRGAGSSNCQRFFISFH